MANYGFMSASAAFGISKPPMKMSHQILVIDQNYFRFPQELQLITNPFRNCIILAGSLLRNGQIAGGDLPSVGVLVYPSDDTQEMETLLESTIISSSTLAEILSTLETIGSGNQFSGRSWSRDSHKKPIDWHQFAETLRSSIACPDGETFKVTFFNQSWQLNFDLDFSIFSQSKVDSLIVAKLTKGSLLDDLDLFGQTSLVWHDLHGSASPVLEISVASHPSEVEEFYRKHVFMDWLSKAEQVDLYLPMTAFNKTPICLTCEARPRFVSLSMFPGLQFEKLGQNSRQITKRKPNQKIRLEVIAKIGRKKICQSLVFGNQCFCLTPVCSGDPTNEKRFSIFWRQLVSNEQSVIAVQSGDSSSVRGHFIIMAAPDSQLILKSIATSEIILPLGSATSCNGQDDFFDDLYEEYEVDHSTVMDMESSLAKLIIKEQYDPRDYSCNLLKSLEDQIKKARPRYGGDRSAPNGPRGGGRGSRGAAARGTRGGGNKRVKRPVVE